MSTATQAPNPLAAGLERLPIDPTTLVIFGATGDLARRKLLPAVYNLAHDGVLPQRFNLVGVARRDISDDQFREQCAEAIGSFSRRRPDADVLAAMLAATRYVSGVFDDPALFAKLSALLDTLDEEAGEPLGRTFYLSTGPNFFPAILERLGEAGLQSLERAPVRVVVEKPFGTTLAEARALNRTALRYFEEPQIFRIDHYLGKETVQNMMALRFANGLFEPLWNRNYIDPSRSRPRRT